MYVIFVSMMLFFKSKNRFWYCHKFWLTFYQVVFLFLLYLFCRIRKFWLCRTEKNGFLWQVPKTIVQMYGFVYSCNRIMKLNLCNSIFKWYKNFNFFNFLNNCYNSSCNELKFGQCMSEWRWLLELIVTQIVTLEGFGIC